MAAALIRALRTRLRQVNREALVVGGLYLIPRSLTVAVLALITWRSGLAGLGSVSLALSLWQFVLVVNDWGVSQWSLTRHLISRSEWTTSLRGRIAMAWITTCLLAGVTSFQSVSIDGELRLALCTATLFSWGQLAFVWPLAEGNRGRALWVAAAEYAVPALLAASSRNPVTGLIAVMAAKSAIGCALTIAARPTGLQPSQAGLSPTDFGFRSSALALTSFASGAGEIAVLQSSSISLAALGAYRTLQTLATLGTIIGFAVQAPLMRKRPSPGDHMIVKPMLWLGSIAGVALLIGDSIGLASISAHVPGHAAWLGFAAAMLGLGAVMNASAAVPLTAIARSYGSRYSLRVGLASALGYWGLVAVLALAHQPKIVPVAVAFASALGLAGNCFFVRRLAPAPGSTSKQPEADSRAV